MILAYLQSKIAILRWVVIILGFAAVFWSGKHWEWLEWQASIADTQKQQLKVVHDIKIVHEGIIRLPAGDADKLLRKNWQR